MKHAETYLIDKFEESESKPLGRICLSLQFIQLRFPLVSPCAAVGSGQAGASSQSPHSQCFGERIRPRA